MKVRVGRLRQCTGGPDMDTHGHADIIMSIIVLDTDLKQCSVRGHGKFVRLWDLHTGPCVRV